MSKRDRYELSPEERAFVERVARSYRAEPLGPGEAAALQARLAARIEEERLARSVRRRWVWSAPPALVTAALAAFVLLPRTVSEPGMPRGAQAALLIEYAGLDDEVMQLGYLPDEYELLSTLLDEPWNESTGES
jgi:hypothetical protein